MIILGAGASVPCGLPVLSRLFDDSAVRQYLKQRPDAEAFFQSEFWDAKGLNLDTATKGQSLEDMMTWMLRKHPQGIEGARESASYRQQRYYLDQVAFHALACNKSSIDGAYNDLILWSENFADNVTVASFNWDLMFEASYYQTKRSNPMLALELQGWKTGESRTTLLKLHGSLSWWDGQGHLKYKGYARYGSRPSALEEAWTAYSPGSPERPLIMEPSAVKSSAPEATLLAPQWSKFEAALSKATHIISIGYSWPPNDTLIQEVCTKVLSGTGKGLQIIDVNLSPSMEKVIHSLPVKIRQISMGMAEFTQSLATGTTYF